MGKEIKTVELKARVSEAFADQFRIELARRKTKAQTVIANLLTQWVGGNTSEKSDNVSQISVENNSKVGLLSPNRDHPRYLRAREAFDRVFASGDEGVIDSLARNCYTFERLIRVIEETAAHVDSAEAKLEQLERIKAAARGNRRTEGSEETVKRGKKQAG